MYGIKVGKVTISLADCVKQFRLKRSEVIGSGNVRSYHNSQLLQLSPQFSELNVVFSDWPLLRKHVPSVLQRVSTGNRCREALYESLFKEFVSQHVWRVPTCSEQA
jgi:hypothetical protein